MQNSLPKKIQRYLKEHLRKKHWKQVVTVLACIVVFCTTYALILPALTMTGDAFCGKEAHQHSDECYERVLICGQEEAETAEETAAVHTHTDACYEIQKVAVCGLEESEGHTHGDSCYDAEGNLTCEQEEAQGHTHTEACYEEESVLICGQEETAPSEEERHVHTDSCYEEKLVCQKEEHEHSLACYSDPNADLEDASVWERSVSGVKLTGVRADDVIAVAQTQLGYEESTKNYLVTDDGGMKGITRYGQWYGEPYGDWDAMFVSFCLSYAGIPQTAVPYGADCAAWSAALSDAGLYRGGSDSLSKGDIVFFDNNGDGTADHVGIVVQLDESGAAFSAVEGDTANRVQRVSHSVGESGILGYAALPENPNGASESIPSPEAVDNAARPVKRSNAAESIALGESKTVSVGAGEIVKLQFTPAYSHQYVFKATSSGDSYGYLYDANGKQLTADDDSGGNGKFKVAYDLTAAETYYWGAKWYSSTASGDITVSLTLGTRHTYEKNEQGEYVCVCGEHLPLSGQCGTDLYWSFDPETGTLSITGSGAMRDYSDYSPAPWSPLARQIKSLTIAEGATSIGYYAFSECSAMEAAALPDTLTEIDSKAFYNCKALAEIDLSKAEITYIGSNAFYNCMTLAEIDLSRAEMTWIYGGTFSGCSNLETVFLPDTLTGIGNEAFSNCRALAEIDLSKTQVTSIDGRAFYQCASLKTVSLPNTLAEIGYAAFETCTKLTEIDLSKTEITSIPSGAFEHCSNLAIVSLPNTLTEIANNAFSSCKTLTEIDLSKTQVTSIGNNAFYSCDSLKMAALPNMLTGIGNSAFRDCKALTEIDLSQTQVTSIGGYAFSGCSALKSAALALPDTLTEIGAGAFQNCTGLTEIVIPETVASVGRGVFANCSGLTELRLEAASAAFDPTQSATNGTFHVTVAETVDELTADTITAFAGMGCSAISFKGPNYLTAGGWQADFLPRRLNALPQGEYFADAQGVLYRLDGEAGTASVFYCPPGIDTYTVPKELPAVDGKETPIPVVGVDSNAFSDASDLTALTFAAPETITTLEDWAFYRAVNLESINGRSDAVSVLSDFSSDNLKTGIMLFLQTKITDSSEQLSGDALVVKKENLALTVSTITGKYLTPGQAENGTFLYYTGETATTTVTVSNPDSSAAADGTVVRVYFYFDKESGRLSYSPGTHTVVSAAGNSYTMQIVQTDADGCCYMELERPKQGDTISIALESAYPSPASGGGNAMVWCDVLTEEKKAAVGSGLIPVTSYQGLNWSTAADTFPVTKRETNTGNSRLVGDGTGGAYISGLSYTIGMSRAGTALEGVGKDHMRSVDFEDVLTLPEGVTLAEEIERSIREGNVITSVTSDGCYFRTVGGNTFLRIRFTDETTNYRYVQGLSVSLDENGDPVFRWRFRNADLKTEISAISFTCAFEANVLVVKEPRADQTYTLHNRVTARQHFMYSEDQVRNAECSATVKTASSSLSILKNLTGGIGPSYYGDSLGFSITAKNSGALPYERLAFLTDDLPRGLYMRPADLAATFAEDTEHQLTVTIVYATLCEAEDGQAVSAIDGSQALTDRQNSGANTEYHRMSSTDPDTAGYESATITVAWGADGLLQISDGERSFSCAAEEDAIRSVLKALGLVVTPKTQYCLKWDLRNADGTVPPLPGGGAILKKLYCTAKDTFMQLDTDSRNKHPMTSYYIDNRAYGKDADNKELDSSYVRKYVDREFRLDKNWSIDGQLVTDDTEIRQGSILDYTLSVTHKGSARYDALPLVDLISGAQALLVPAAENSGAEWARELQTVTAADGTVYYLLSNPGTYRNVRTSKDQLADTVTVAQSASGLDTLIKWYFADYTGNRSDTVSYRTYVCPSETVPGALVYSLGNEVWLNDHQSHRLYSPVGWVGTIIGLNKVIVDTVGDTGVGCRYSPVGEGDTVVYRLALRSYPDADGKPYTLKVTGQDMYDALPLSNSTYRWSKENVRITYQDNYTVTNGDNWSVEVPAAGDQQYIRWGDDFSITFAGTAYIYVELDFPSGIPWQEYAVRYATSTLVNSFHVLSGKRSVTHAVSIAAEVRLQKGVYDTGYFYHNNSSVPYKYVSDMSAADDRLYYQNNDVKLRAVKYYVTLYNGGPTNLYLTDMQDLLPRGFTYFNTNSFNTTNATGNQVLKNGVDSYAQKSASVTVTTSMGEDGRQRVLFHFTNGFNSRISYDEDRQICYLKPGEYIDFVYTCRTNETPDTDDMARNVITMPYYDFNNGGVIVDDECQIVSYRSRQYTPNDGGCDVLDNGQAENLGFIGGTNDTQWITSAVTVIRGGIKPGITKALTGKTSVTGATTPNPISAAPSDTLNWTIKTENDGTKSISDYVLTDRMQAPYMFTGEVSYLVYETPGDKFPLAKPASDYLFRIAKEAEDGTVAITTSTGEQKTLTLGGDPIVLSCEWNYSMLTTGTINTETTKTVEIKLSIVRDEEGNNVLSLYFPDSTMSIPENGSSELTLSTYNSTNTLENKQFINTCFVTPLTQIWDGTANKGNVVKLDTPFADGELPTVRNSAPVTTSYGYVTSSSKRVAEADNPDNTAACTDETNFIVLGDETKRFVYTLTVDNSTPKAMDKFILIDGLPDIDDHTVFLASDPRFSEFKVSLADDPQFSVTVTDKEGNVATLNADSYTVEYSEKTEFTAEDWQGGGTWSASAANARSVRLKIFDASGTLIPAESTIALSFTCKVDSPSVQPGQIAWNSFGYHYRLINETNELEAAPLKVGVKVPSVPELRKQTVDHSGQPRTTEQDEAFRFLIYPGAALQGEYTTEEELIAALGDTPYEEFTVTVKAGESLSDSVRLQTDKWRWTKRQEYTVVELPCGETYAFRRFLNSAAASYTLTYTPAQTQIITCENIDQRWRIELKKENTSHEPLSGAVFALYSPNAADRLPDVPEEYADLSIALSVEHNNRTWYLAAVQTTPEDGKLSWDGLLREQYYLLEVKAPDGYNRNSPAGQIVKQENETQGLYSVTVINRLGYTIPETGGPGTYLYTMGGALLLLGAGALLLYYHLKRRRGDGIFD